MTQIKIFKTILSDNVNKWLEDHKDVKVVDIKISSSDSFEPYIMIIYEV